MTEWSSRLAQDLNSSTSILWLARMRNQLSRGDGGVFSCSYANECSEVCPKNVDPSRAIQQAKFNSVLDWAKFKIDDGPWRKATEVLKIDQAARDHFGLAHRGGEMVQPWFREKHLPAPAIEGTVHMAFPFRIEVMPDGPVTLCMERPEHFSIKLNGLTLSSAQVDGWWVI